MGLIGGWGLAYSTAGSAGQVLPVWPQLAEHDERKGKRSGGQTSAGSQLPEPTAREKKKRREKDKTEAGSPLLYTSSCSGRGSVTETLHGSSDWPSAMLCHKICKRHHSVEKMLWCCATKSRYFQPVKTDSVPGRGPRKCQLTN